MAKNYKIFKILMFLIVIGVFVFSSQIVFAKINIRDFGLNNLNTTWQKTSDFGKKIWGEIESIWQNKTGDKTKEWCAKKWKMIKQEFSKEIEEMKNDINDSLHGKFNNIKFWEKIFGN